ncbi:hypothetical protein D9M70_379040 [compost metagenome]
MEVLAQDHLEQHVQRGFDRRTADFAVALRDMRVADREQGAIDLDGIVHGGPRTDTPVVDIAAMQPGLDGSDPAAFVGRDPGRAKMGAHRHAHTGKRRLAAAFTVVDHLAGRGQLAGIVEGIERMRGVGGLVQFVDRDPLFLELPVELPPVRRNVGPEAKARDHLQIAHLQHVAGPGILDIDGPGHDVHTRVAVIVRDLLVDRADGLIHHQVWRIAGVMGHGFGTDEVAAFHGQRGRLGGIEITPVDGLGAGGQVMQHVVSWIFFAAVSPAAHSVISCTRSGREGDIGYSCFS